MWEPWQRCAHATRENPIFTISHGLCICKEKSESLVSCSKSNQKEKTTKTKSIWWPPVPSRKEKNKLKLSVSRRVSDSLVSIWSGGVLWKEKGHHQACGLACESVRQLLVRETRAQADWPLLVHFWISTLSRETQEETGSMESPVWQVHPTVTLQLSTVLMEMGLGLTTICRVRKASG